MTDLPSALEAWLAEAEPARVQALLAPPAPTLDDLHDLESEYYLQTRRMARALRRRRPVSR